LERKRNASIDSLRGIAAVLVIFYHSILNQNDAALSVLVPPIQDLNTNYLRFLKVFLTLTNGHNAVLLFFVLSGFVLMLSMERDVSRGEWSWFSFIVRRFMRLFPALVAALAVCFAIGTIAVKLGSTSSDFMAAASPSLTVQNMLLWKISMHGASWTIQVEVLVIPFLLVGFWMARRFGVAGLIFCLAVALLETQTPFLTSFSPTLSGALFAFYAGMLAAKLILSSGSPQPRPGAILLMALLYVFATMFVSLNSSMLVIVQILASAGLVACVYSASAGLMTTVMNSRPLVTLGRISYSLYLLNVPVMWVMLAIARNIGITAEWPVLSGLLVGITTTAVTIPMADAFERAIERPANALGKRLTSRDRPTAIIPAE
jgi:peptidoglycan/LPS O-acetylase OafA/YrhL